MNYPYNGRARIKEFAYRTEIKIPTPKHWFSLFFATAWLGGWYFGFSSAFGQVTQGPGSSGFGFILFWLIGWTIGGGFVLFAILWGFFGREKLVIKRKYTELYLQIFDVGYFKRLETKRIKNIRVYQRTYREEKEEDKQAWGLGPGRIKFDYGMKTYTFGKDLDDAEANYLLKLIKEKIAAY